MMNFGVHVSKYLIKLDIILVYGFTRQKLNNNPPKETATFTTHNLH